MARKVTTKEVVVRYKADTSDFTKALKNLDKSAAQSARSLRNLEKGFNTLFRTVRNVTILYYMGRNLLDLAKAFTETADAVAAFRRQANNLADSSVGFDQMVESANRLRVSLGDMGKMVNIFVPALDKMGLSFQESLGFIENLTKSMRVYGVQGEAARNSTIQLAQAFSSGRLQGDELRSMSENAGGLYANLESVVQGMLETETSLRDLGTEGVLTTDTLLEAFGRLFLQIDDNFAGLPKTVAQSLAVMNTEFSLFGAALNEALQVNPAFVEMIELITSGVKSLRISMGEYAGLGIAELFKQEEIVAKKLAEATDKLAQAKIELEQAALADQEAFFSFGLILTATQKNLVDAQREVAELEKRKEKLEVQTRDTGAALLDTGDAARNAGDAMNDASYDAQGFADSMMEVVSSTNAAIAELAAFRAGGLAALNTQRLLNAEKQYADKLGGLPEAERNRLVDERRVGVVAEQQLKTEIRLARESARASRAAAKGGGGGGGGGGRAGGGGRSTPADTSQQDLQNLVDRLKPVTKLVRVYNEELTLLGKTLGYNTERYQELSTVLTDDYVAALDKINEKDITENLEKQRDIVAELTDAVSGDLASVFNGLIDGTQGWSEALTNLEQALMDAITQVLVITPLMTALKALMNTGFSSLGIPGLPGTPGRAIGGPVAANTPYMVGERGPELFVPASSGKIKTDVPRSEVNVSVNFNGSVTGEGLRQSAAQIAAQVGAQTQRAIARNG